MSVKIRMKSMGRKHRPFFRICAIDSRKSRDGLPIEEFGTYDPMVTAKSDRVKIDLARFDYWVSVGAIPSQRVATLVKKIRTNRFGTAQAPPAAIAPKPVAQPEAAAEGGAEGTAEESSES